MTSKCSLANGVFPGSCGVLLMICVALDGPQESQCTVSGAMMAGFCILTPSAMMGSLLIARGEG